MFVEDKAGWQRQEEKAFCMSTHASKSMKSKKFVLAINDNAQIAAMK